MGKVSTMVETLPYLFLGFALIVVGIIGSIDSVLTLEISLILASLVLAVTLWIRRPKSFLIIDAWLAGFIIIFFAEMVSGRELVLVYFPENILATTEAVVASTFGATLLGYALALGRWTRWFGPPLPDTDHDTRLSGNTTKPPLPIELMFFLFAFIALFVYFVLFVRPLEQLFTTSRAQLPDLNLLEQQLNTLVTVLPIYVTYILLRFRVPLIIVPIAIISAGFAIFVTFAGGTRFLLGFVGGGILFFLFNGFRNLTWRQILLLALAGVTFFFAQDFARVLRGSGGIANADFSRSLREEGVPRLNPEGLLLINSWIHANDGRPRAERLPESLFILYWWVPRSVWPSKPTMAGYWFPREMTTMRGYGSGHSFSGGFAFPALLDFGLVGGTFFSVIYGVLIAWFEAVVERRRSSTDPISIVYSLLYFTCIFMIRSLHTSLIFVMVAYIGIILPIQVFYRFGIRMRLKHRGQ